MRQGVPIEVPTAWTTFEYANYAQVNAENLAAERPIELLETCNTFEPSKLLDIVHWSLKTSACDLSSTAIEDSLHAHPQLAYNTIRQLSASPGQNGVCNATEYSRIPKSSSNEAQIDHSSPPIISDDNGEYFYEVLHDNNHTPLSIVPAVQPTMITGSDTKNSDENNCISCLEDFPKADLIILNCRHGYCKACLSALVMTALQNESAFPPKCCLNEIPLHVILIPLDNEQRQHYKQKAAEYSIPANRRWYCPNKNCLKWIPPDKLQRIRISSQKCPHCSQKICSTCRDEAHRLGSDCPQDYGLESTLDIAEAEGWRRCFSCHAMVELTSGCRHITCKCKAQFCYVCGKKWRTCKCTESDQQNRQEELRRLRRARDQITLVEAEEIAAAIAEIDAMELREAEAARLSGVQQRQREEEELELELARLESLRLEEERVRQIEREEVERQFQATLRSSLQEQIWSLEKALQRMISVQFHAINNRQTQMLSSLVKEADEQLASQRSRDLNLLRTAQHNVDKRTSGLLDRHATEQAELLKKFETDNEMILQTNSYLQGQPDGELQLERLQNVFSRLQDEDKQNMAERQTYEARQLKTNAKMELEGVKRSIKSTSYHKSSLREIKLKYFQNEVLLHRTWFQIVSRRRIVMLERHSRLILEDFDTGRELVGLTEAAALQIPLFDHTTEKYRRVNVVHLQPPTEPESPISPMSDFGSIADHSTWSTNIGNNTDQPSKRRSFRIPGDFPQNGAAYLSMKNGESSKSMALSPTRRTIIRKPLPTPPDTPEGITSGPPLLQLSSSKFGSPTIPGSFPESEPDLLTLLHDQPLPTPQTPPAAAPQIATTQQTSPAPNGPDTVTSAQQIAAERESLLDFIALEVTHGAAKHNSSSSLPSISGFSTGATAAAGPIYDSSSSRSRAKREDYNVSTTITTNADMLGSIWRKGKTRLISKRSINRSIYG